MVKEKEEEEAKQAAQQAKKEKEIQKKAIKKERQKLRTTCKVRSHRSTTSFPQVVETLETCISHSA